MIGVAFGKFHTYHTFSLYLSSKKIGAASPIYETVEVPGADAPLDFTEFFGDVHYKNRTLTFEFTLLAPITEHLRIFSDIQNAIHGRKMKIVLDTDPAFFYFGRVTVKEAKTEKGIGKVSVECDCEPYKYRQNKTVHEITVTEEATVQLENLRQHVVPSFNSTAAVNIEFEGAKYSVSSPGAFTVPEIVLKEGVNMMKITGAATVKIEYQEGGL